METNSLGGAGQFTAWQKLHKQGNPRNIFPLIRKREDDNDTVPLDSAFHESHEHQNNAVFPKHQTESLGNQARKLFRSINPGCYFEDVPGIDPENPENRVTINTFARRIQYRGWLTEEQKVEIEPIKQKAEQAFRAANPSIRNIRTYGTDPENPNGEKITFRGYVTRKIKEYWNQELSDDTSSTAPDVADH